MKKYFFCILLLSATMVFSQRGKTGDKTFAHRFPEDKFNRVSNASLTLINEVDHDIIVVIRDQEKKYIRHVYIEIWSNSPLKNCPSHECMYSSSLKSSILKIWKGLPLTMPTSILLIFSLIPLWKAIILK